MGGASVKSLCLASNRFSRLDEPLLSASHGKGLLAAGGN